MGNVGADVLGYTSFPVSTQHQLHVPNAAFEFFIFYIIIFIDGVLIKNRDSLDLFYFENSFQLTLMRTLQSNLIVTLTKPEIKHINRVIAMKVNGEL